MDPPSPGRVVWPSASLLVGVFAAGVLTGGLLYLTERRRRIHREALTQEALVRAAKGGDLSKVVNC